MPTQFPSFDGQAPKQQRFAEPPEMGIDPKKRYTATMSTSLGELVISLDAAAAPRTVNNFVFLALHHSYDGVIFHRIIRNFMIQGGDPLGMGYGGPGYQFRDEIHPELAFNRPFLLAMANAGPGTNGSQFFITTVETPHLQGRHTIFGEVADEASQKVVLDIEGVPTGPQDRPIEPVVISRITVE